MEVKLNGNSFFRVTAEYGARDDWHHVPHSGIDLAMNLGTKIYSPTDGVVERVCDYGSQNIGKGIIVRTDDGEHLVLGHLSDNSHVYVGEHVHTGDFLGLSGSTGRSSGPHLHVGLRDSSGHFTDPHRFFSGDGGTEHIANHIATAHDTIQSLSPGELLQNALSEYADTLANLGLNLISSINWDFIIDTLDCIITMFGI